MNLLGKGCGPLRGPSISDGAGSMKNVLKKAMVDFGLTLA